MTFNEVAVNTAQTKKIIPHHRTILMTFNDVAVNTARTKKIIPHHRTIGFKKITFHHRDESQTVADSFVDCDDYMAPTTRKFE